MERLLFVFTLLMSTFKRMGMSIQGMSLVNHNKMYEGL